MRLKYADWVWKGSSASVSQAARDFVERVGNEFPDKRLTVKEALQHPFITRKVVLNRPLNMQHLEIEIPEEEKVETADPLTSLGELN